MSQEGKWSIWFDDLSDVLRKAMVLVIARRCFAIRETNCYIKSSKKHIKKTIDHEARKDIEHLPNPIENIWNPKHKNPQTGSKPGAPGSSKLPFSIQSAKIGQFSAVGGWNPGVVKVGEGWDLQIPMFLSLECDFFHFFCVKYRQA